MKKLLLLAVISALTLGFLSCNDRHEDMPILNYDGKEPTDLNLNDIPGIWKAVDHHLAATWLNGKHLPIEFSMVPLEEDVNWHYIFEDTGEGLGRESRRATNGEGFDNPVEYDFEWEISGIELHLTLVTNREQMPDLYGDRSKWYVTQLTPDKMVLYDRRRENNPNYGKVYWHNWYIFEKTDE